LLRGKTQFCQSGKGKPYHNWRPADDSYCITG
jgi:hypothetical protein